MGILLTVAVSVGFTAAIASFGVAEDCSSRAVPILTAAGLGLA